MVTKNKDLLLGASYFDLSHSGYIETKDLEDILAPLQLDLSRAEIKKLAAKLATKDQVDIFHIFLAPVTCLVTCDKKARVQLRCNMGRTRVI